MELWITRLRFRKLLALLLNSRIEAFRPRKARAEITSLSNLANNSIKNKAYQMRIIILLVFTSLQSIFPAEIILKSGKAFICDVLKEEERKIKVLYKDKPYSIPRSEIQNIEYKTTGSHSSRYYQSFDMKDGSLIKGLIAKEDNNRYTLQTGNGFIVIDKANIVKEEKDFDKNPEMPKEFLEIAYSPETRIGIGGTAFVNGSPLASSHPVTSGGFLFIEPAFLIFKNNLQLGYRVDYYTSVGNGRYDFFNNFGYVQYNFKRSRLLHFYLNLGAGASSIRYQSSQDNYAGINPAGYIEAGWQGLQWDRVFLRLAVRGVFMNERGLGFGMGGGEISFGVKI